MNWNFAPSVAVPRDDRWGRTYEGFAEEPMLVAELGAAAVRGLQGDDLSDPSRVVATAKHFVGDGGTVLGTGVTVPDGSTYPFDRGDVPLTEEELRRIHMEGYVSAVAAGVGTLMPSYSSWNGVKCSGSRRLLTEIVKEELGFEGFLISDFKAIDGMRGESERWSPSIRPCPSLVQPSKMAGVSLAMGSPTTGSAIGTRQRQCTSSAAEAVT